MEAFETRPVKVRILSLNGNVSTIVATYKTTRVAEFMQVIDWNKNRPLENIAFSTVKKEIENR